MAEHIRYLSAHSPFVISCILMLASRKCWRSCSLPANADGTADGADAFCRGFGCAGDWCAVHEHIQQLAEIAQTLKPKTGNLTMSQLRRQFAQPIKTILSDCR